MKLSVKELQVLDNMLHACSYYYFGHKNELKKYVMIVKIDNKLVKCNFLQFINDSLYPMQSNPSYNGDPGYKRISNYYLFDDFTDKIEAMMINNNKELIKALKNNDLLIDLLLKLITKEKLNEYPDYDSNKIYNVTFLESNLNLDFCFIDTCLEYELLSIIVE